MTRRTPAEGEVLAAGDYARLVLARWYVVVGAAVAAAGLALAVSTYVLPQTFQATTTMLVSPTATERSSAAGTLFVDDQSVGRTFEVLATQPVVQRSVAQLLAVPVSEVSSSVNVHAVPKTPLLEITYSAPTADEAMRGARVYADAFAQAVIRGSWVDARPSAVSPAIRPTSPSAPRPLLNTVVAFIAGLLLAIGVICLVEQLARSRPASPRPDDDAPGGATVPQPRAQTRTNGRVPAGMRLRTPAMWPDLPGAGGTSATGMATSLAESVDALRSLRTRSAAPARTTRSTAPSRQWRETGPAGEGGQTRDSDATQD